MWLILDWFVINFWSVIKFWVWLVAATFPGLDDWVETTPIMLVDSEVWFKSSVIWLVLLFEKDVDNMSIALAEVPEDITFLVWLVVICSSIGDWLETSPILVDSKIPFEDFVLWFVRSVMPDIGDIEFCELELDPWLGFEVVERLPWTGAKI